MAFLNPNEELSLWKRICGNVAILENGCWQWLGKQKPGKHGYTYLSVTLDSGKKASLGTYRAIYALIYGLPEKGLFLDHLCRNPSCCNPKHLEPVTPAENQYRSPISISTKNRTKTECVNGHLFTEQNTYEPPKRPGRRYCKSCLRTRDAKYKGLVLA